MKTIEEYKQEMLNLYSKVKVTPVQATPEPLPPTQLPDEEGGLLVFVTTLRNLYGVENARVSVLNENDEEIDVDFTDKSGKTKTFLLPTVPKNYSEDSTSTVRPYSVYKVRVTADGYEEKRFDSVAVFPTITSILPVDMVLTSAYRESEGN